MPLEEETAEGLLTLFLSAMHGHHERQSSGNRRKALTMNCERSSHQIG